MVRDTNKLNILMVTSRFFPLIGGTETHVYEVGQRLACLDVNITILTTMPHTLPAPLPKEESVNGMRVIRVPAWPPERDYYIAPEIFSIVKQNKWDIIHCQGYHTFVAPIAMFAALQARIPYVLSFHTGGDSTWHRKVLRGVQRKALRPLIAKAERLIGPSKWEVQFFEKHLRLPSSKFAVVPNGSHHLPESMGPQKKVDHAPLILSIGRLERYKGHQRVISALPKLLEHVPDARLRIVGVGPYESTLQNMVRELGLSERVEIRGVPPGEGGEMAALIGCADLVTLLSEHEAQGIVVLEALARQRPVLVAATSALQEFVDRGLVRSVSLESKPEEVAAAMVRQLRDPLVPEHVELPTWDDCATNLLRLYQSIVPRLQCVS